MLADIHQAIFTDLQTFGNAQNISIAYPNVDFTPGSAPYLRVNLLFAASENIGLEIVNQPGVLQVDVMYRDGLGVIMAANLADALVNHLPRNRRIQAGSYCVLFNSRGYVSPPLVDGGWVQMPVNFNFRVLI